MLTARRRRGRALKRKHVTRRKQRKQRLTRKRLRNIYKIKHATLKGAGNSNNENENENENSENENDDKVYECDEDMLDRMEKEAEDNAEYFEDYYETFFEERDAKIQILIDEEEKDIEKLQKKITTIKSSLNAEKTEEEREKLEQDIADNEYDIRNYEYHIDQYELFKYAFSLKNLKKILKDQGEKPIVAMNDRLDSLRRYMNLNPRKDGIPKLKKFLIHGEDPAMIEDLPELPASIYNSLPRLKKDIRVWRTLTKIKDKERQDLTNKVIMHTLTERGVASTAYNFENSIHFGTTDRNPELAICLEFVIPAGTAALPLNMEIMPHESDDESEIIILDDFHLKLTNLKCHYDGIDVYECTFTKTGDF